MENISSQEIKKRTKTPIDRAAEENIYQELKAQYEGAKQTGYGYRYEDDLDEVFRAEAAILAAGGGVSSIYDIGTRTTERSSVIEPGTTRPYYQQQDEGLLLPIQNVYKIGEDHYYDLVDQDGNLLRTRIDPARILDAEPGKVRVKDRPLVELINKKTNEPIYDVSLYGNWREDPLSYNFEGDKPVEVQPWNNFNRIHTNYAVRGAADLSFQMVPDGQGGETPLILPVYRSTKTDLTPLILGASLLAGGLYFGPGAAAGAAGSGATAGTAAGTGLTAGAGGVTGLTSGAAGVTGLTAPAGFTLAPGVGASLAAGGAGYGLLDSTLTSSIGETGLLPGATEGFQASAIPSAPGMGGAQGLTVPVAGGTVTASGLIPTGATIPLGGGKELGLLDAARGLNNLRNLTFKPPQPGQQQQPMSRPQSQFSLPAAQPTVVGLLPLAERYRRSLL